MVLKFISFNTEMKLNKKASKPILQNLFHALDNENFTFLFSFFFLKSNPRKNYSITLKINEFKVSNAMFTVPTPFSTINVAFVVL